MARITKISITLCALLFTLPYIPLTQASEHARPVAALKTQAAKSPTKSKASKNKEKTSSISTKKSSKKTAAPVKKKTTAAVKSKNLAKTTSKKSSLKASQVAKVQNTASVQQCAKARKGRKAKCVAVNADKNLTIAQAHKVRVQKAQKTAMNKLMGQIGKPYRWGGTSPRTGFDCSGLVYYAYKDLVKFRIPRTANEMYHLRDAASVDRGELESGDLVFFRTRGRGTADHVGVYVGNGKFIQSPRSGQDIQITSLSEDYWQRHYVGAKRVMTPKTIR
ncbi:C40 family peptidase [Enterobacteriaceae bacterium H20N1]|uniref:C40 family peptidase n=1 Tax=Dryocola boscaweniae TaxID=2925397 RepID=A0A9X2WAC1_9ENTR|nr:C40 family peptidase [Dryocola boscaweniae]MCT4703690.1 C40 family peptidase [Dryocola boscaweniae]MCT4716868.1 C40 family peptidase [Dryocola boscaweniae]MCT4720858.1 C40 family peptidase [Dryocola boscaweniae]